jgi:hypothetical protein
MVIAIYDKYGRYFRVNKKTTVWFGVRPQRATEVRRATEIPDSHRESVVLFFLCVPIAIGTLWPKKILQPLGREDL